LRKKIEKKATQGKQSIEEDDDDQEDQEDEDQEDEEDQEDQTQDKKTFNKSIKTESSSGKVSSKVASSTPQFDLFDPFAASSRPAVPVGVGSSGADPFMSSSQASARVNPNSNPFDELLFEPSTSTRQSPGSSGPSQPKANLNSLDPFESFSSSSSNETKSGGVSSGISVTSVSNPFDQADPFGDPFADPFGTTTTSATNTNAQPSKSNPTFDDLF